MQLMTAASARRVTRKRASRFHHCQFGISREEPKDMTADSNP